MRVRSPLLAQSRLISFPPGTEMFQFPGSPVRALWVQARPAGHHPGKVSPFGDLRVKGCVRLTAAYRSLPRPSSALHAKASTVCPLHLLPTRLIRVVSKDARVCLFLYRKYEGLLRKRSRIKKIFSPCLMFRAFNARPYRRRSFRFPFSFVHDASGAAHTCASPCKIVHGCDVSYIYSRSCHALCRCQGAKEGASRVPSRPDAGVWDAF